MAEKCLLAVAKKADTVSLYLMNDLQRGSCEFFLTKKEDFDRVKREGKRVQSSLFNVITCSSSVKETRVGIVIGLRFGNAVSRNRGKRIFRELVRKTNCLLAKGYDIVVFPKRQILQLKHQAVLDAWVCILEREGLLIS